MNHEYISFPLSLGAPETPATLQTANPRPATSFPAVVGFDIDGPTVPQGTRWGEFLYNMGGTIVRLRKGHSGRYATVADRRNRRIHGLSGLALNAGRSDLRPDGTPFSSLVSWGDRPHQQGDRRYLIGTGPAATDVMPHSSDGLGNRIIGTGFGCSGALTPWGTVLSCEENFQGGAGAFFVGVQENVLPDGTQTGYVVGSPATVTDPVSGQHVPQLHHRDLLRAGRGEVRLGGGDRPGRPQLAGAQAHRHGPGAPRERGHAGRGRPQAGRLHGRRPPRRPHLEVRQRREGP